MTRFFRKKGFVLILLLLALGVAAVAGYAYFSATGSGTAPAAIGTSTALTLHGSSASTLYPGRSSTISFTVDNTGTGPELVGTIHLASVVACAAAFVSGVCPGGQEITTCETVGNGSADFSMPDVVSNQDISPGTGQPVTLTGTLTMNDLATSQDSCKNANLLLNLTS
jgi:hypothetical protein